MKAIPLALICSLILWVGCQHINWRGQSADDESMRFSDKDDTTKYVSEFTGVWGLNSAKVEGLALVTQLAGTGSDPPQSGQRSAVIKDMQAHGVTNPTEILASKDTSIAMIVGLLPPGIRKGERFDVLVKTLPNSETTSLRGGFVMQTGLRPMAMMDSQVKTGHETALVKGRVLVQSLFEPGKDQTLETTGYILGGGVALHDREIGLAIRDPAGSIKAAVTISRAINTRFSTFDRSGKVGVAEPKNDKTIRLLIPEEYEHNVGRYVQVVMNLAFQESAEQRLNRLERLAEELNDPALAQTAALRLEAIGREAIPALKRGLRHEDSEVRFHAAQALAYLDQSDGIAELKRAALADSDFRWHALTALASSEDIDAGVALADLLHIESAETRYGAFRSMMARSPNDPLVASDPASNEFYLHVVPTTGSSMIHFARQTRPEIVIFGGTEPVEDHFLYVQKGLTIQVGEDALIEAIQYLPGKGEQRSKCPNSVSELLRLLTQLGFDYETILAVCKESKQSNALNCRMVINAVPSPKRLYTRDLDESGDEIVSADGAGHLPTLFGASADESTLEYEPVNVAESEQKKRGVFAKMRGWFTR